MNTEAHDQAVNDSGAGKKEKPSGDLEKNGGDVGGVPTKAPITREQLPPGVKPST